MAHFEKMDVPESNTIAYHITDDDGQTAHLSPEQALDLLQWLTKRRDELHQLTHQQHHLGFYPADTSQRAHEDWSNDE